MRRVWSSRGCVQNPKLFPRVCFLPYVSVQLFTKSVFKTAPMGPRHVYYFDVNYRYDALNLSVRVQNDDEYQASQSTSKYKVNCWMFIMWKRVNEGMGEWFWTRCDCADDASAVDNIYRLVSSLTMEMLDVVEGDISHIIPGLKW